MSPQHLSAARIADLTGRPRPTREQTAVIEAPLGPVLVVAGAGSGKTETMAGRVVYLVANGVVSPGQVLGLTFTRKAAAELSVRIRERLTAIADALVARGVQPAFRLDEDGLDPDSGEVSVRTYNGFAADLVTDNALRLAMDPGTPVLSQSAAWQLAHRVVTTWDGDLTTGYSIASLTAAVVSASDALAGHGVGTGELAEYLDEMIADLSDLPVSETGRARATPKALRDVLTSLAERRALVPVIERYAQRKRELGVIDFSDQIRLALDAARRGDDLVASLRETYRVVLLDEFQDTSAAQLDLLEAAFGRGHATCAVGDPQQAIYGWRGASAASLDAFAARFGTPARPVRTLGLATSWRNDTEILRAANAIAAPLRRAGSLVRIPELTARPGAGDGCVEVATLPDADQEAEFVATRLVALREDAARAHVPTPSQAVLVRSQRQMAAVLTALDAHGLHAEVVGLGGLVHRPEVADLRALLEAASDPTRSDSLLRLLTGPRTALGPDDLAVLGDWSRSLRVRAAGPRGEDADEDDPDPVDGASLVDAVEDPPGAEWVAPSGRALSASARERLHVLRSSLRAVRRVLDAPLTEIVTTAERALGLDTELEAAARLGAPGAHAARRALDQFLRRAREIERGAPRSDLPAFLDHLQVSEEQESGLRLELSAEDLDPEAVTILTMHAAKGLEWDHVASVGWSERAFPSYRATVHGEDGTERVASKGWLGAFADGALPSDLRSDAEHIPHWAWAAAATQKEAVELFDQYRAQQGAADVLEERRVAYVAITRARHTVIVTSCAYANPQLKKPRAPSRFLLEIARATAADLALPAPGALETNPLRQAIEPALWPPGEDSDDVRDPDDAAHDMSPIAPSPAEEGTSAPTASPPDRGARQGTGQAEDGTTAGPEGPAEPGEDWSPVERAYLAAARRAAEEIAASGHREEPDLPTHLSASQLVALARDRTAFVAELARPVPHAPSPTARRGSEFHAWLENRFSATALLDLEDLAIFDDPGGDDTELARLRDNFRSSEWAGRRPVLVEHPLAVRIGGRTVRGVIDAVFARPDGGATVVDWKTGSPPHGREKSVRELQLAVYRIGYARESGLDPAMIDCAFYYARENRTRRLAALPDEEEIAALLEPGP